MSTGASERTSDYFVDPTSKMLSSSTQQSPRSILQPTTGNKTSTSASDTASSAHVSPPTSRPSSLDLQTSQRSSPSPKTDDAGPNAIPADLSDVDPQILEALRSKDRIYVLKLGEIMESLILEEKPRADLTPSTTYQRLLVHRCSAFYRLTPEGDPVTKGIYVLLRPDSRIPERRLADLVPADAPALPSFKIMLRNEKRNKPQSHAGSVAGDSADLSDVEPSETGSQGGRSNATGGSGGKKHMTIEEREAAYNEARSRIFMDFEERERAKEKDASTSSSSQSIVSGSTSALGDDLDDSASSIAPESEWSAHSFTRDNKKDYRRNHRSLRKANSNGAASSRNSRAPSPMSFNYGTVYEPPPMGYGYDPSQIGQNHGAYNPPYMYPAYSQPPTQPMYPVYYPYPYPPPPHFDPNNPPPHEGMYPPPPPPPPGPYGQYMWPGQIPPMTSPSTSPNHSTTSQGPPPNGGQYQHGQFMPPNAPFTYPMPGYYTPQPNHPPIPPPPAPNGQYQYDYRGMHEGMIPPPPGPHQSQMDMTMYHRQAEHRGNSQPMPPQKVRNGQPHPRAAWSYGPGIGNGGMTVAPVNGDVGPRFGPMRRQPSNHSNTSSNNHRSTSNDEVSSIASSSTSSSSRRTYTSATSSSHHPLPARPDWAVGLKPDGTLHPQDPKRSGKQLESTDFPPLSSTEKRPPAIAGAWTNAGSRSIHLVNAQPGQVGNALVRPSNPTSPNNKLAEEVLPSVNSSPAKSPPMKSAVSGRDRGTGRSLTEQMGTMSMEEGNAVSCS